MTTQQKRTLLCSTNAHHSRHTSRTESSRSSSSLLAFEQGEEEEDNGTRTSSSTSSESYRSVVLREVVTACTACGAGAGSVYWKDYLHQEEEQQQQSPSSTAISSSAETATSTATGKADTIKREAAPDAAFLLSRMRRASTSRRYSKDNILASPPMRSRSSERSVRASDDVQQDGVLEALTTKPEHRRCQSDMFDAQQDFVASSTESEDDDDTSSGGGFAAAPLPTLPRYPVQDQRNKNCWSVTELEKFSVRGPAYFKDQKKVQSGPYQLETRGSDLFLLDKEQQSKHNIDCVEDLCEKRSNSILGGQLRKKPTLAVNFRFPWGYLNLYFEIPEHLAKYTSSNPPSLDSDLSIGEKTFAKWLTGDTDYRNQRLKLIPYVAEGPWVVRNMVTGRPALIGTKLPVSYRLQSGDGGAPLLTATLDIGSSISATAKRIVSVCRRYMSALTVDIGFVIQSEEEEELPEQMLGAVRVHAPDPMKAPKLK